MEKRKLFFVAEHAGRAYYDAGILRFQQQDILLNHGATALQAGWGNLNHAWSKIARWINCYRLAAKVGANDIVFFHFPYHARMHQKLQTLLKQKATTVALVIDIDGLRDKAPQVLAKELEQLAAFKIIVAHNEAMQQYLQKKLPANKVLTIHLFDYVISTLPNANTTVLHSICFAGNLQKSGFVQQLQHWPKLQWHLYGNGHTATGTHIEHHGTFSPANLPALLQGFWGLVWDGNSTQEASDYLTYNSPHKLSLYLAAGKPLIVWEQSAVAQWVATTQTGILVKNFDEIPSAIATLSIEKLAAIQQAVAYWQQHITKGAMLSKVLQQILSTSDSFKK
jgi:hypothetical protein